MNHELQHNDGGSDHCVNCGTFKAWLTGSCEGYKGEYRRQFDFDQPENWKRQAVDMFGEEAVSQ